MDFLDSLDLDMSNKKSHRVRSWYLYEQFKSLERNQLQAAQKLKDRSYQDKILRQELAERKARRKIYDQFGLCHSESGLEKDIKNSGNNTELSVSADDFFESVCELQDEVMIEETVLSEDTFSQDDSVRDKCYTDEFKTEIKHGTFQESVTSVVENLNHGEMFFDDIDKILKAETNMVQNIHLQLDDVKENIQSIEKYTELADDNISEADCIKYIEEFKTKNAATDNKAVKEFDSNLLTIWSRLVSFAYQIMQLNHGWYDCGDYGAETCTRIARLFHRLKVAKRAMEWVMLGVSLRDKIRWWRQDPESQILIRMGALGEAYIQQWINVAYDEAYHRVTVIMIIVLNFGQQFWLAMCCEEASVECVSRILQPYVSPINYASDESDVSVESINNLNKKEKIQLKKTRKSFGQKLETHSKELINTIRRNCSRKFRSEECWGHCSRESLNIQSNKKYRRMSEPWRSISRLNTIKGKASEQTSSSSIWPDFSIENLRCKPLKVCDCCWRKDMNNSMMKITRYLHSMLQEIEKCNN